MTEPEQKIAVSGASGLIGASLCSSLQRSGHRVQRLIRDTSQNQTGQAARQPEESAPEVRDIPWEPLVGVTRPDDLGGLDAIVHLAGRSIASARWTTAEKERIRDSRVEATSKLVAQIAALENPPQVFISASATGIYGDCGSQIVDESSALGSDFLASVAQQWESVCDPLVSRGVRVIHLRFGIVLTKSGGALGKMLPLFRGMLGGRLGSGKQYWSWVALEDCIGAIRYLLESSGAQGSYNIVSPNPVTNSQFTADLAAALARPAVLPAPRFALRLALGEMADALLLSSCRAIPGRLEQEGFEFQFPDLRSFLRQELA